MPTGTAATGAATGELLDWFKAAVPLGVAAIAAWTGYRYGLRRTRDERGFDRRIAWYEGALARLDDLQAAILRAAESERARAESAGPPEPKRERWDELIRDARGDWATVRECALAVVTSLKRAAIYAHDSGRAASVRATELLNRVAPVFVTWDVNDPNAHPSDPHPLAPLDEAAPDALGRILEELTLAENVLIAEVRTELGFQPPRASNVRAHAGKWRQRLTRRARLPAAGA